MKWVLKSSLLLACGLAVASTSREFDLLGHFDNVVSSDQGEHCGGYSLDLWNAEGRLLGLLHHHSGLCGDPACTVIDRATLDRKTGRLTFASTIGEERFSFRGFLEGKRVVGKLNGRALRLKLQPPVASHFEPDASVGAWCSFWKSVPRCRGVKELCAELQ